MEVAIDSLLSIALTFFISFSKTQMAISNIGTPKPSQNALCSRANKNPYRHESRANSQCPSE